jgi:hypothetical protein
MQTRTKYGLEWPGDTDDLKIEMSCICKGGRWQHKGKWVGEGLIHHYEQMRRIIWPELDCHRWHVITRDAQINHKISVFIGAGSTAKTHSAAWYRLCEYFCWPNETLVLISSTDMRGLRLRVWGEITSLWERAVQRFPQLPGHLLDSKVAITTDEIDDGEFDDRKVRDLRKGLIGIPTIIGNKSVGLGKWIGAKQQRMRLIADEAQLMGASFLSAFANLNNNASFEATICGNPKDTLDPLGQAAEPLDGWDGHMEPEKTCTWKTRFMDGICVNLVGTDSPNFDYPSTEPTKYKYLISREKIAATASFFSKDSPEYYSQCVGVMKIGTMLRRIVTRQMCKQFKAQEPVFWKGNKFTKIAALDAAYGGDRCVLGHADIGEDVDGKTIIHPYQPVIVPLNVTSEKIVEDQISQFVMQYCERWDIPPENFFHDSTGRGTLGTSLARIWSAQCNPVEFGGKPTNRVVSLDMWVIDGNTKRRRLMLCNEHYDRFVTELWFTMRYVIESGQMRNLPTEVMDELCSREYELWNNKRVIEKKEDMKLRIGKSPDLADWLSIICEGARRRGFVIAKLGTDEASETNRDYLDKLKDGMNNLRKNYQLDYAA